MPAWFHLSSARRTHGGATPLGRVAGVILSMLMTAVATHALLSVGASAQAPPGCAVCEEGFIYGTTGFAGSYAVPTPDGPVPNTYCITQGLNYPNTEHTGPVGTDYADQPVWAALFDLAGPSDNDKAAVSMRVHRDLEGNGTEWNAFAGLRAHSDSLWDQAVVRAGPFTTVIEWRQRPDASTGGAGTVAVSVRASSGAPIPHATVSLSGSNLVLAGSLDTGPTGVAEVAVSVANPGPWAIEAVGASLPPTTVLRYEALAREQTVVGPGPRTSAGPAGDTGSWDVPTAVTVLKIDASTRASAPGAVIEIRDSTGSVAATIITATDPLPVSLPAGDYTARETREPDGYLIDDPSAQHFAVTMLGGRVDLLWSDTPAAPTVATRASAPLVSPGDAVHDRITVFGLPPSIAPFPVLVRYLGPVPPPTDGDCAHLSAEAFAAAGVLGEATVTVTGNGDFATTAFTAPSQRGCTTFDVTSRGPLWPGGPTLAAAPNAVGESIEVVSVEIATTISPALVAPGGSVSDRITVTGLPAWSGARQLTVRLIGPITVPSGGTCTDLGPNAFDSAGVLASLVLTVAQDGGIDSPALPVDTADGQCVTIEIKDNAPLWPGGPVLGSPRGLPSETALVRTTPTPTPLPTTTPVPTTSSIPTTTPVPPAVPATTPRTSLATTGPEQTRALIASGLGLLCAGIGLLLLIPGTRASRHTSRAPRDLIVR